MLKEINTGQERTAAFQTLTIEELAVS